MWAASGEGQRTETRQRTWPPAGPGTRCARMTRPRCRPFQVRPAQHPQQTARQGRAGRDQRWVAQHISWSQAASDLIGQAPRLARPASLLTDAHQFIAAATTYLHDRQLSVTQESKHCNVVLEKGLALVLSCICRCAGMSRLQRPVYAMLDPLQSH